MNDALTRYESSPAGIAQTLADARPYGGTGRRTPSTDGYTSRHWAAVNRPGTPEARQAQQVLATALHRTATAALNLATNHVQAELVDYLAGRVELAEMLDTVPGLEDMDDVAKARWESHTHTMVTENARAVLVALGINTGDMALVDFPTVTRYWLACRNAYGWKGGHA